MQRALCSKEEGVLKINFDFPTKQIQVSYGMELKPGENDLPDEIAEDLVRGSDALIASIAEKTGKSEKEVRTERKGKGIFTKVEDNPMSTSRKRRGGGE